MRLICAALASVVLVTGCSGPSPRVAFVQEGEDWRQISLSEAKTLQRQQQVAAKPQTDQSLEEPQSSIEPMSAIPSPALKAEAAAPAQDIDLAEGLAKTSPEDTDKTSVSIAKEVCNIPGGQNLTSTPPCTL